MAHDQLTKGVRLCSTIAAQGDGCQGARADDRTWWRGARQEVGMASTEAGGSQLFVRQSTGLVREASALDATIYNAVFSAPVGATLAWGVFFALSAFPGADLVWATIISFVLNVPVLIMMALLAASMPRTGGDYVWVSRILSPPPAVVPDFRAPPSPVVGGTFLGAPLPG